MDNLDLEQVEISESPGAIQVTPVTSVESRHHSDGDGGAGLAASPVITQSVAASAETDSSFKKQQEQEQKKGQEWEETYNGGAGSLPSRQPDAPIPASTIQLLESGSISERQSPEAVQDHYPQT
jgi:hypothetical protein